MNVLGSLGSNYHGDNSMMVMMRMRMLSRRGLRVHQQSPFVSREFELLFEPRDHFSSSIGGFQVSHDKPAISALKVCITFHHLERRPNVRGQIDLGNYQQVRPSYA